MVSNRGMGSLALVIQMANNIEENIAQLINAPVEALRQPLRKYDKRLLMPSIPIPEVDATKILSGESWREFVAKIRVFKLSNGKVIVMAELVRDGNESENQDE